MHPLADELPALFDGTIAKLKKIIRNLPDSTTSSKHPTVISGKAKWQTCWRHACYLSKNIYKDPPPSEGFQTQFQDEINEIEKEWVKWDEFIDQKNSGLVVRHYKKKDYEPLVMIDICPPTLVFRGTDFDDMRDLVVNASVTVGLQPFPETLGQTYGGLFMLDNSIDSNNTREKLLKTGFKSVPIHTEKEDFMIESASDGLGLWMGIKLELELLLKEDGDWLNNIKQGLGRESIQYNLAIKYG